MLRWCGTDPRAHEIPVKRLPLSFLRPARSTLGVADCPAILVNSISRFRATPAFATFSPGRGRFSSIVYLVPSRVFRDAGSLLSIQTCICPITIRLTVNGLAQAPIDARNPLRVVRILCKPSLPVTRVATVCAPSTLLKR
jgi:hypothetical protein